jgi:structural maintenance of chromosome 3 (chondroitin sulfate proteoglycan 6)
MLHEVTTLTTAMIHTLSESAQFITTTFRPELCAQAEQFYGVFYGESKVSHIKTITKDEALQFIDHQGQEAAAAQQGRK